MKVVVMMIILIKDRDHNGNYESHVCMSRGNAETKDSFIIGVLQYKASWNTQVSCLHFQRQQTSYTPPHITDACLSVKHYANGTASFRSFSKNQADISWIHLLIQHWITLAAQHWLWPSSPAHQGQGVRCSMTIVSKDIDQSARQRQRHNVQHGLNFINQMTAATTAFSLRLSLTIICCHKK